MTRSAWKKSLGILALLALTAFAMPVQRAVATDCSLGDPWFFCQCARNEAQICASEYQACGGFLVPGCWEAYSECRLESGIDLCE